MRKKIACVTCPERPRCRSVCEPLERVLQRREHHFRGREILVGPQAIAAIFSSREVPSLSEFMRDEVRAWEVQTIPGLTDHQLRVLTMSLAGRKTHRTIARVLGCNQSTVGEHLLAARRKARRYLEERLRAQRQHQQRRGDSTGNRAG